MDCIEATGLESGIERLRNLKNTRMPSAVYATKIPCRLLSDEEIDSIADQIEREHAEELDAAKRDLTDDDREAVGRLRELDADCTWGDVFAALFGKTISPFGFELRDRLCDLIEHGGKQDVDVAALRELEQRIEELKDKGAIPCRYFGRNDMPCDGCPANDSECYGAMFGDVSKIIHKAIEGAPVDLATAAGNLVARCRPCRERREAAADWIEARGGLEAVRDRMEMLDEFRSDVAKKVGVEMSEDKPMTLYGDVFEELDKRLMPEDMGWPRDTDGNKVDFGEEIADDTDDHCARAVDSIKVIGGIAYLLDRYGDTITSVDTSVGERVERAKPAMLGADGKPIVEGETVYGLSDGKAWRVETIGFGSHCVLGESNDGTERDLRPEWLTHTPPDTQERIDEDKGEEFEGYWGCDGCNCEECPSLIDGEKPCENYGVLSCAVAQGMDIARREQELRARTNGGAR